jgi:excisionase family DNA binding protein
MPEAITRLAEVLASFRPPTPLPSPKPFLSLDDAVEYSGLPKRLLTRMIRRGRLPAARYGKLYVKRADIDRLDLGLTLRTAFWNAPEAPPPDRDNSDTVSQLSERAGQG